MARFISVHRAPGLSHEEFMMSAPQVFAGKRGTMVRVYANLAAGFIIQIYDAESREALESEYERLGFPFDEIHEVQLEVTHEELGQMLRGDGAR
jgi:hypothetical protein